MNLEYYLYLLVVVIIRYHPVNADSSTYRITDQVNTCSNYLSSLIDRLCNNEDKIVVKRDTSLFMDKLMPVDLLGHMNKQRIVVKRWRRMRRQIIEECCNHPCTVANLVLYCPDNSAIMKEHPDLFE